ncbi:hypothetical protein [Richelia intracellularis]|nr:hypothetical protein [Richelia intracellularis]
MFEFWNLGVRRYSYFFKGKDWVIWQSFQSWGSYYRLLPCLILQSYYGRH